MTKDPLLRSLARREQRSLRVPLESQCVEPGCNATDHLSLSAGRVRCYTHLEGPRPRVELDHPAGHANMPEFRIGLFGVPHRRVTLIRELLASDFPPANNDPLLTAAHFMVGVASLLWLLAEWLRDVALWLAERMGPDWFLTAPPLPFST